MQTPQKDHEALNISGEAKANHGVKPEVESGRFPEGGDTVDLTSS